MRFSILSLLLAACVAAPASALVCSPPFQSWTCADNGYYDVLDGQPGEVLCGTDYTGWTIHVVEVTLTEPMLINFAGLSAVSGQGFVATEILLMDDCAAGTCAESAYSAASMAELITCLDTGTYTFVVASQTQSPAGFMNIGLFCATCQEAVDAGYTCELCMAVGNEAVPFGELKARFR